ncbi:MAG: cellulose biosynthesis cyclic di-GMP-binding regulatory protein BcsB [Anaerolineaceae bacterium]|nr:cellulose biosynthesis cyclic di-GMP-binding regulatory protein BcsB [Anaerolineaceae bacterium]
MKKTLSFALYFLILMGMIAFISPLNSGVSPVYAQSSVQTTPTAAPTSQASGAAPSDSTISFSQLGLTDTILNGPYDTLTINFSTPDDWQLQTGATVQLTLSPSFTPGKTVSNGPVATSSGGILYVSYNGSSVSQIGLTWTGENSLTLAIPPSALKSTRQDGRQQLQLFLNAGTDCQDNARSDVVVKANSSIFLPHAYIAPDTSLSALPKPFYIKSNFAPIPAVVVIPDKPSTSELQAALTTVAGFSRMSQGNLSANLIESSQLNTGVQQSSNLIFVGKAAGLPALQNVAMPVSSDGTKFAAQGANPDDGIVEMFVSPWNKSNVVLVVGGNSDAAVVKAAQAVSSGTLRSGTSQNLTYVADVLGSIESPSVAEDRTLADLGYASQTLTGIGIQSTDITFMVPAGQVAKDGSFLKLIYNNSGLIDFNSSGLTVYLNGDTIGSQSLSKDTASNTTLQISIPIDSVKQGINTLTIEVNLDPSDNCSLFAQDNLWATISSDSLLHLPLASAATVVTSTTNLGNYPYPFISSPTLKTTTFVVSATNPASWSAAAQVAANLGKQSSGALVELGAVFADQIPDGIRQSQDLLVVGQASTLPLISELDKSLPAPFASGSDIATERAFRVVYNLPAGTTIGYLELMQAPWQTGHTILTVLGSNPAGLNMAAAALTTSALHSKLGGDFAVVNGSQVLIADSRLQMGTGNISATVVPVSSTPEAVSTQIVQAAVVPDSHPGWMLPTILVTLGLILAILIGLGVVVLTHKKS